MYCKAGVQCTNPEVYGDIKRGRRLAPSKGILCSKCQGKCCNESCLERHKCKQRNRPNSSGTGGGGMRVAHHARWQSGLDANGLPAGLDPNMLLDPNMAMLLARNGMLLPQGGMPLLPLLPMPLMLNPGLQQGGAEGLSAAELQAALASMGGGLMLGADGAGADTATQVSQALQLAQLQGLGNPLLQLMQPDQRLGGLPPGLMQGMLPGGLQLLSQEQLAALGADAAGNLPLMQMMAAEGVGTSAGPGMDQATMDAAVAAAVGAGGLGGGLMAGLTAMGANLGALAGLTGPEAQALLEQHQQQQAQQQQDEAAGAAAIAAAAAALGAQEGGMQAGEQGMPHDAAGMPGGVYGTGESLPDPSVLAGLSGGGVQPADLAPEQLAQQQMDAAAAAASSLPAADAAALAAMQASLAAGGGDPTGGLVLPGIAPLQMAAALAGGGGAPGVYQGDDEGSAAAALMSLATKNKAAAAAAMAQSAAQMVQEGILPQAVADQTMQKAQQLAAEAAAEEAAEAAAAAAAAAGDEAAAAPGSFDQAQPVEQQPPETVPAELDVKQEGLQY